MEERLRQALARAEEVATQLAHPTVVQDPARLKTLGREHARLQPLVAAAGRIEKLRDEYQQARELAQEADPELVALAQAELDVLQPQIAELESTIQELLIPRDPHDDRDAIVEIRAGTGGDEAALFAADLERMYRRFAERHGLTVEAMSISEGSMGGYKEVVFAVRGEGAFGRGPWFPGARCGPAA